MSRNCRETRGFTLIELLVVIVILAILAALITVAAVAVLVSVRESAIKQEMKSIATTIEMNYGKSRTYPPSDPSEAASYVRAVYPESIETPDDFTDSRQSLVYWLEGFSADPVRPITGPKNGRPLFDFRDDRLDKIAKTYRPPGATLSTPYEYERINGGRDYVIRSAGLDDMLGTEDDLICSSE